MKAISSIVEERACGSEGKTTIYTVARMAGVSISTVSRVLNHKFSGKEEVREKILQVVQSTHYSPSQIARKLTGKKTRSMMIGVMAPFFTDQFFVEVLKGIYRALHREGYHLILYDVDSKLLKKQVLAKAVDEDILDGLIMVNMHLNEEEYREVTEKMPLVLVAADTSFADSVAVDNYKGIVLGLDHVFSLGHRRVAFVNNEKDIEESRVRERAFLERSAELGIDYRIDHRKVDRISGFWAAKSITDNNPEVTCLVFYSDLMAYGGLDLINQSGLRGRVSVVGFDGFEVAFQVGLTTVVQPMEAMGDRGASILLQRIEQALPIERVKVVLDPVLEKGKTCWRVPGDQQ